MSESTKMSTFTIEIKAPELTQAINNLASALANAASLDSRIIVNSNAGCKTATETGVSAAEKAEDTEALTSAPAYTIEDVRAAFSTYAKSKGKDRAKELLSRYGASKVTALNTADYTAVMKDIEEG